MNPTTGEIVRLIADVAMILVGIEVAALLPLVALCLFKIAFGNRPKTDD